MKYLLFNMNLVKEELENDMTEISNEKFEELAVKYGKVITSHEDFEAQFNAEMFSTETHQLRIIV